MNQLAAELLTGNRRALARLLTYVENEREGVDEALAALFPHTGKAWVIGVTGAPGTGKSSLVNVLAKSLRERGRTVAIIAVDPTSPFSGGAILGDRIRMRDLSGDPGIFIRSMATRGSLGGLARATRDAIRLMDAAGFDVVLVETVGAGQNEIDIVRAAQTIIVVEAPGMGDEVQAIKAGILEIASVLVVNKADRPGVTHTVRALRTMLEMGHPASRLSLMAHHGRLLTVENPEVESTDEPIWLPPIVQTVATENKGLDELNTALEAHRTYLQESDLIQRLEAQQFESELKERLQYALLSRVLHAVPGETVSTLISAVQNREIDPQGAVRVILSHYNNHNEIEV